MKFNLKFSIFIASIFSIFIFIWLAIEYSQLFALSSNKTAVTNGLDSRIAEQAQDTAVPSGDSTHFTYLPAIFTPRVFLETFDVDPAHPTPFSSPNWDVTIHSRDEWFELDAMDAAHGLNCEPPPATHRISAYEDAVFSCKNHVMTSIYAPGYGAIYLTPNELVDFSGGEAIIQFDMSTERTTGRDWVDIWITPYEDNLQLPLDDSLPDLSGEPRNGFRVEMDGIGASPTEFMAFLSDDFHVTKLPRNYGGYERFFAPDAKRRDTFELRISKNRIRFGLADYNFWWVDTAVNLDWDKAVVQLGHHSYNPDKDCRPNGPCGPNSWHWDNVTINPSIPFTMLHADTRYVADRTAPAITLSGTTPANAHLRFAGVGRDIEVSFDGGNTWQDAQVQAQRKYEESTFWSYWTPIPQGVTTVHFRGKPTQWNEPWVVRDITVWSLEK